VRLHDPRQPPLGVHWWDVLMSYSNSRLFGSGRQPTAASENGTAINRFRNSPHTADGAIDEALRSVPLPQGLMTRLGLIAYATPDDAADKVDWLGC
jgi:hypothetical protein